MEYFIGGIIGFILGVIVSCILLAKKNLETKDAIEATVTNKAVSFKDAIKEAKEQYKAQMKAYDEANKE